MALATLIIPISNTVPFDIINEVILKHKQQTIQIDIIISIHGTINDKNLIKATVVEREYEGNFSLSKTRNAGAWVSSTEWLIFTDIDTLYNNNLFERMIKLDHDAVAGRTRRDISVDGQIGIYNRCGFAPLLIRSEFFEKIGGYNEKYSSWGYEDSSFEHKIENLVDYDSNGDHWMSIHNIVSSSPNWKRGQDTNRALFFKEQELPLEERIKIDRETYIENKLRFVGQR